MTPEQSSREFKAEIPVAPASNLPIRSFQPTAYDYLALVPGLITAATPVILAWLQLRYKGKDKDDNK